MPMEGNLVFKVFIDGMRYNYNKHIFELIPQFICIFTIFVCFKIFTQLIHEILKILHFWLDRFSSNCYFRWGWGQWHDCGGTRVKNSFKLKLKINKCSLCDSVPHLNILLPLTNTFSRRSFIQSINGHILSFAWISLRHFYFFRYVLR